MIIHNYNGAGASLDIPVNDRSYRLRQIMGEDSMYLYFSLPEYIDIKVGAYVDYQGLRYYLHKPDNFKKHHTRNYEHSLTLTGDVGSLVKYKIRDVAEKRLKFPLTAKPQQHLQMLIDNLNARESGWTMGSCIDAGEKLISYNHNNLLEALQMMADAFETEWEVKNKVIHLRKVEYNHDNPLALAYGKGKGFKPGLGRSNVDDKTAIEILHVQGGVRNIDYSKYESKELLLPAGQNYTYEGRVYKASADGLSIQRADKLIVTGVEDSLDLTNIYPQREGAVSLVTVIDAAKHFYDFADSSIPAALDYEACRITGEKMTVVFQTGLLAGREFDIDSYVHSSRTFKIVPAEQDGLMLPDSVFKPAIGDKYAVFGIHLPQAYIRNDATQEGASWDMFKEGVRHLYEHETPRFTFTGELDGIWAKQDWFNIGGKIVLGGYVHFSDDNFLQEGTLIRIVGVKDYLNNPHSPEIDLSNNVVSSAFASQMAKIKQNEVVSEDLHRQSISYAKRRYRDSIETLEMLQAAFRDSFTNAVSPVTVKTMALLVGDESLQFRFVNNMTTPVEVTHVVTYNSSTKILNAPAGIIQHMTLGLSSIAPVHKANEYKFWDVANFNTPPLTDPAKSYYLYIKASKASSNAVFYISENPIGLEAVTGFYHFLMGVLNAEDEDDRSYVSLYGFSEVLPGRVTTNKIVSADGNTFIDLQTGEIQGDFTFKSGKTVQNAITEAKSEAIEEAEQFVDNIEVGGVNLILRTNQGLSNLGVSSSAGSSTWTLNELSDVGVRAAKATKQTTANETWALLNYFNFRADKFNANAQYCVSFKMKTTFLISNQECRLSTPSNQLLTDSVKYTVTPGDWQEIKLVVTTRSDFNTLVAGLMSLNLRLSILGSSSAGDYVILKDVKLERGNKATAWSAAPEDISSEINVAKQEALNAASNAQTSADTANTAVGNLNTYVEGSFKDGVIEASEAKAIEKYINVINTEKSNLEATYNTLYSNNYLEGTPKSTLLNAKVTYFGAVDALLGSITTAIADGKTTQAEKNAVDTNYNSYKSALASLKSAIENANKAIQVKLDNIAKGYVDAIQVGGRNLLRRKEELPNTIVAIGGGNQAFTGCSLSVHSIAVAAGEKLIFSKTTGTPDNNWRYRYLNSSGELIERRTSTSNAFFDTVPTGAAKLEVSYPTGSEVKIERGTKVTDWTPAPEDVPSALEYLAEAMQGDTSIDGGLVATNLLQVKDLGGQVRGGMSGLANDNIGFWSGGTYQEALDGTAKTIFRKDGTGHLGGGRIQSNLEGLKVGDLNIDSSGAVLLRESGVLKLLITKDTITSPEALIGGGQSYEANFTSTTNTATGVTEEFKGIYTINNDGTEVTVITTLNALVQLSQPHGYSTATINIIARYQSSGKEYVIDQFSLSASGTTQQITGSKSVNATSILPAGTMYLVVRFENVNSVPGAPAGFVCSASAGTIDIFHSVSNPHSEIGKNGFMFGKDSFNFAYFGVDDLGKFRVYLRSTGDFDMPGVLLRGTVDAAGGNSTANWWGPKNITWPPAKTSTGRYVVYHSVLHVNYTVTAAPRTANRSYHIVSKDNTQFIIEWRSIGSSPALTDTEFDFQISGSNFLAP